MSADRTMTKKAYVYVPDVITAPELRNTSFYGKQEHDRFSLGVKGVTNELIISNGEGTLHILKSLHSLR